MAFEESLAAWLPAQRWFAGKEAPVTGVSVEASVTLAKGDPELRHLIIAVQAGGDTDRYQVLAGLRADLPERLAHAEIGPAGDGMTAYDALHDHELTSLLLAALAGEEKSGHLRFAREPGTSIDTGLESVVLTGEQSNTSLMFGESAILKVFRRPTPGPNGDLEVPRALARLGSPHVAAPLAWVEGDVAGGPAVLAILSSFLRAAVDGWSLAATSVRDLYATDSTDAGQAGGDFAGEAERLGEATADLHRDLALAFGVDDSPLGWRDLAEQLRGRLDRALASAPELARHEAMLRRAYDTLAAMDGPLPVQRIHGDYHLGQVMRTQTGWVVLDFEGEPAAAPHHRRTRAPTLRDVAGMLRSFDYAARHQLSGGDDSDAGRIAEACAEWARRNQLAFLAGYTGAGGAHADTDTTLLRALLLDKAAYEVMYEAKHRPSWLFIPLGYLADEADGPGWYTGAGTAAAPSDGDHPTRAGSGGPPS